MAADDEARRKRARDRAGWPVRKYALGQEPDEDLSALTPGERVAMVWRLTQDAWATAGLEIPSYARNQAPGKVVRGRGHST